ncbi:hypothetical protein BYT27DRAFT_7260465 [Phlegmacium glaucopus]|nr:hypothetical protein BYT27DRAFT_7260465 [Phlegmacium glaucopus]
MSLLVLGLLNTSFVSTCTRSADSRALPYICPRKVSSEYFNFLQLALMLNGSFIRADHILSKSASLSAFPRFGCAQALTNGTLPYVYPSKVSGECVDSLQLTLMLIF